TRLARAQSPGAVSPSVQSLALQAYQAIVSGKRAVAAGLALLIVVYGLRRWVTPRLPKVPAFAKIPDVAAMVFTILCSLVGAIGTALAAGQHITAPILTTALTIGFGAAGGFAIGKKALF